MKKFHENVNDDYSEWFVGDLVENLLMFIDMIKALDEDDLSKSGRKKMVRRLKKLKAVINEEIDMIGELQDERDLTNVEKLLFAQIKILRGSNQIKTLENATK